jgi:hypothetical protein
LVLECENATDSFVELSVLNPVARRTERPYLHLPANGEFFHRVVGPTHTAALSGRPGDDAAVQPTITHLPPARVNTLMALAGLPFVRFPFAASVDALWRGLGCGTDLATWTRLT